jgi:membrane-associated protein
LAAVPSGNPASIALTVTATPRSETTDVYERHRRLLLALAGVRAALAIVAVPLVPFLYEDHVAVLVLLRPTKEVLLFAGFALARGDASLPAVVAAALPLLLGGVWALFALGRAYADCIDDESRTGLARRLLPPARLRKLRDGVCDRGTTLVFLGRLAAFPSTLVGAAAGAAQVPTKRFLLADTAGALLSIAVLLGLGFLLEEAYDEAGPWLTAAGAAVLAAGAVVLSRSVARRR